MFEGVNQEELKELMKNGWSYPTVGVNYIPTDSDLEKIASMINSGIAQSGVLLTDKTSNRTFDIYVEGGRLTMKEVE